MLTEKGLQLELRTIRERYYPLLQQNNTHRLLVELYIEKYVFFKVCNSAVIVLILLNWGSFYEQASAVKKALKNNNFKLYLSFFYQKEENQDLDSLRLVSYLYFICINSRFCETPSAVTQKPHLIKRLIFLPRVLIISFYISFAFLIRKGHHGDLMFRNSRA